MDKIKIRKEMISNRLKLANDQVLTKSEKIMSKLFSLEDFKRAKTVMFYVDMRNEVMTKEYITKAINMDKSVVVPKVKGDRKLSPIEIQSLDDLAPGVFGVLEPTKNEEIDIKKIDFVVVPGVAFDKERHRLGYGGGYYDNFLPKLRKDVKKVAVCYEMQIIDRVPTEPHDIKVDMILTEENTYI